MQTIVYSTSANPPTWGHADILCRAAQKFDLIYWAIGNNPEKFSSFTTEQRMSMMQDYVDYFDLKNVIVDAFEGATIRYARKRNAQFILRGLRNTSDFHYELELAAGYRGIDKDIETICMLAKPHYATISSSLVRELAQLDEKVDQYVLKTVAEKIRSYLKETHE